jgi:dipeptidyl aminopeptidase/acylaminoacyl peptidase
MKKLIFLAVVCLIVPLQHAVSGQQTRAPRLLNDWCYPGIGGWGGWEMMCSIAVIEGDGGREIVGSGHSATWSPDGLRIAYTDGLDVYVLDRTDDSLAILAAPVPGTWPSIYGVSWSPDGARIAFIEIVYNSPEAWQSNLVVMNADGSNRIHVNSDVRIIGSFAWAPTGAAIAFPTDAGGSQDLYTVKVDGSNLSRLTSNVGFAGAVSWSKDSSRIAFDCGTTICAVDPDGTNLVTLTANAPYATSAVFSPAGGSIAFVASGELVVQSTGGAITHVAPGLRASGPRWSPDGTRLAFVQEALSGGGCQSDGSPCAPPDETFVVNADGSGLRMVGYGTRPVWFEPRPCQPAASFTVACTGAACQFDAVTSFDPDGTIGNYAWRFGDGTTGSGPAPAHTFAIGARYDVSLIVTDNSGARDVTGANIYANAAPLASFTVSCDGPTCTFDGSASLDPDGTIGEYRWNFGDGSTEGPTVASIVTHSYRTGTYTPSLVVADRMYRTSDTVQRTLSVVNGAPVASFTGTCLDVRCTFDGSSSSDVDDGVSYFQWTFGDGFSYATTGHTVAHYYPQAGTYTVTLTVVDRAQQATTTSRTVTVTAPPPMPIHIGDIDGSASNQPKTWNASATIAVHTAAHGAVGGWGITITGFWDDGTAASCSPDSSGRCVISKYNIARKASAVTFTISGAVHTGEVLQTFAYSAAANHDADGDSNGTVIRVRRP